jgi:hypothetical protein
MPKEFIKKLAGASVSDAERKRIQDALKGSTAGAVGEATGAAATKDELDRIRKEALKKISGAAVSGAEAERFKDNISDYASGGEVVMGKGKDYIKDLL